MSVRRHRMRLANGSAPASGGGGGGGGGDYSSTYRYAPRYSLVTGRTYNPATGLLEGEPFAPNRLVSGNEVTLTEQGSPTLNRAALQTVLDNIGSDAARVIIPPTMVFGDMLRLPGVNHVGVGLTIESAAVKAGTWIPSGQRVSATEHALMPTFHFQHGGYGIANPNGNPETRTIFSLQGSVSNVRFRGLRLRFDPTWAATLPNLVPVSGGSAGSMTAGSRSGLISNILDEVTRGVPAQINVEQCWIEGAEQKPLLRGLFINGDEILYEGNWIDNVHFRGNDSQCILCTDYGRRVIVRNNYLAQSYGESIMAGGGTTTSAATIPQDWLVEQNWFDNPARFLARGYDQKNLLEWKTMLRSEISRNKFTGYKGTGYDGQTMAIVFKCITQNNGPDFWNLTKDVLLRLNDIVDCRAFLSIAGDRDSPPGSLQPDEGTQRVEVCHNRVYYTSVDTYSTQAPRQIITAMKGRTESQRQRYLAFHHNSMAGSQSANIYKTFMLDAGNDSGAIPVTPVRVVGRIMEGNVISYDAATVPDSPGAYFLRDGLAFNSKSNWDAYTDKVDCSWSNNAIVGGTVPGAALITGDLQWASRAAAGLDAEHRLSGGSPLLTADSDGGPVGCDHALLDSALTGV